jgi:hypothetical protein
VFDVGDSVIGFDMLIGVPDASAGHDGDVPENQLYVYGLTPPEGVAVIVTCWPGFMLCCAGETDTVSGAPGAGVMTVMPTVGESAVADALSDTLTQ